MPLNSLDVFPFEVTVGDDGAWSQLLWLLKSMRAEERYLALKEASDLLGAAIARGELDGESANKCMIALFTSASAVGDGIPRASTSRFTAIVERND